MLIGGLKTGGTIGSGTALSSASIELSAGAGANAIILDNRSRITLGVNPGSGALYLQSTSAGNLFLVGGGVAGAGGYISDAPSGSVAFQANTAGGRLKLSSGGTNDYMYSDGSNILVIAGGLTVLQTGNAAVSIGSTDCGINLSPNATNIYGSGALNLNNSTTVKGNVFAVPGGSATTNLGRAVLRMTGNVTTVGNVGGGEDDLMTYAVAANTLSANTLGLRVTAWGSAANNANAKTVKLYFGATAIASQALTISQAGTWCIIAEIMRTGVGGQTAIARLLQGGTVTITDIEATTPAADETGAITVKCTGTATSDNDVTQKGLIVEALA